MHMVLLIWEHYIHYVQKVTVRKETLRPVDTLLLQIQQVHLR